MRVVPEDALNQSGQDAVLIDIRSEQQRNRDGVIPRAVVIQRNVLEWRLTRMPRSNPELAQRGRR